MALGKRKDGQQFIPTVKYDSRTGRVSLQDRHFVDGAWSTESTDVTDGFQAVIDLANIQRGWFRFPSGAAPEMVLVPAGQDPGEKPSSEHREGLRVLMQVPGSGVREMLSTAHTIWNALDGLHDQFLSGLASHPDQLPLVELAGVKEVKGQSGTNYAPIFAIKSWVPRPTELDLMAREVTRPIGKGKAPSKDEMSDEVPF